MNSRIKERIVVPNMDNYRAGMIVYETSNPRDGKIVIPKYDNSIMAGRVLHPILRRDRR